MDFSEQLIHVFNTLAEKFGVVIDWSSKNVLPYLQDLCKRIINYEIVTSSVWIVVVVVIVVLPVVFLWYCRRQEKREREYRDTSMLEEDWDTAALIVSIFAVFLGVIGAMMVLFQVFDIVKACTIPEATIINLLKGFGGGS